VVKSWAELFYIEVLLLVVFVLVFSVVDSYFDTSNSLNYLSAIGLNTLFLLSGSLSILLSFIVFFFFFERKFSDKTNVIFSYILSSFCLYFLKYILIVSYDVMFAIESLIIAGEVLFFAWPIYYITQVLREYGRGFQH